VKIGSLEISQKLLKNLEFCENWLMEDLSRMLLSNCQCRENQPMEYLRNMLLSICGFRENRFSGSHTLRIGEN
jgi:hypothetical protein